MWITTVCCCVSWNPQLYGVVYRMSHENYNCVVLCIVCVSWVLQLCGGVYRLFRVGSTSVSYCVSYVLWVLQLCDFVNRMWLFSITAVRCCVSYVLREYSNCMVLCAVSCEYYKCAVLFNHMCSRSITIVWYCVYSCVVLYIIFIVSNSIVWYCISFLSWVIQLCGIVYHVACMFREVSIMSLYVCWDLYKELVCFLRFL